MVGGVAPVQNMSGFSARYVLKSLTYTVASTPAMINSVFRLFLGQCGRSQGGEGVYPIRFFLFLLMVYHRQKYGQNSKTIFQYLQFPWRP